MFQWCLYLNRRGLPSVMSIIVRHKRGEGRVRVASLAQVNLTRKEGKGKKKGACHKRFTLVEIGLLVHLILFCEEQPASRSLCSPSPAYMVYRIGDCETLVVSHVPRTVYIHTSQFSCPDAPCSPEKKKNPVIRNRNQQ